MRIRPASERPKRSKVGEMLGEQRKEGFSVGVDFDRLQAEHRIAFLNDLQREGNRPLYHLNLLEYLSVVDPEEFERIIQSETHDFEYYKEQLIEQAAGGTVVPVAVRLLSRLFPESRKEMAMLTDVAIRSFFRSNLKSRRLPREIQESITTGVNLLFLLPERQDEIRRVLKPFIDRWLSAQGSNWVGVLVDCMIADPTQREVIRAQVQVILPKIKKEIVDSVSAYWKMSDLRILEADSFEVTSDSRLVLTKNNQISVPRSLPERNLVV